MKLTLWRESHKENLQAVCTPFLKIQDNGVFGFVSPCFLLFTPLFGSRSQVEKDISNCVCPDISSMGGGGDAPGTPAFSLTAAVLGAEADLSREREAGTGLVGAPPRRHMEKGKERT